MRFKTVFSLVVLSTLMMTSIAIAQGQSSRASALKRRIFDQVYTGTRRPVGEAVNPGAQDNERRNDNYPVKNALAGTWDVVLTFPDGSQARSTLQIMLGAADGIGSALHASEFSLVPPNPTLPEQGSWRHVNGRNFVASYYGYSFDELLQPFGKIGFRHAITLAPNQDSFTGQAVFQVLDINGQVLFEDTVTSVGTRQRAVAP